MNTPLEQLRTLLVRKLPNAFLLLVDHGWGEGYLRVYQGGELVVIEYRAGHGYGVTRVEHDDTGFENPNEVHADVSKAANAVALLLSAHDRPGAQPSLLDGLAAARGAVSEVMSMLVPVRGGATTSERLSAIFAEMERMPGKARSNFTGDPEGVVAHLERIEEKLRTEAARFSLGLKGVREKLDAVADTMKHLANMTASADKARLVFSERHRSPA